MLRRALIVSLLASLTGFAEPHKIDACQPALVQAIATDYDSPKALMIAKAGTYVCPDGFDMYVSAAEPAVKDRSAVTFDRRAVHLAPPGARVISTPKQEYVPICLAIK